MRTALAIAVGICIAVAILSSFSEELGLNYLMPGFEDWKTTIVGVIFVLVAIGGLFHRYHRRKSQ